MAIQTALDAVRAAPTLLEGMRRADELTVAAVSDGGARAVKVLARAAREDDDQLAAIAAVHALAQIFDDAADAALLDLLDGERAFLREHAAWAIGGRLPRLEAIAGLVQLVRVGGFAGMLAQRTLGLWGASLPDHLALALEGALLAETGGDSRARLVETIGLVPGVIPERLLLRVAGDGEEFFGARSAAVAALGDRRAGAALLASLAATDGPLTATARLAAADHLDSAPSDHGRTVAQLFLHADIDGSLSRVGAGDNGGIATLLVRLGDALIAQGAAERVITLSRGTPEQALHPLAAEHAFATVPFDGAPVSMAESWPRRIAAERGIRRALRAAGHVDVLHLRMADVGSLAAASVARELDIPIVFTVAPDPHGAIDAQERAGTLTRGNFGERDAIEHLWFRVRLVQRLAADSAHTVLFPRPDLERSLRELVGIDVSAHPERHTIVPEGIDLDRVDSAVAARGSDAPELDTLLSSLPAERRGLPLLISVGRMHRVKGMAALAEAWSADARLHSSANLLIVGGDVADPSADEREQFDRIAAVAAPGLLLAGHRPNDQVARWLAAARFGRPGLAAPGGAYVCASQKEEFGIALLEAIATGLPVVAPNAGGPATYVQDGVTGLLVDTADPQALTAAVQEALTLQPVGGRAMVAERYTIAAMARALAPVYAEAARQAVPA
ncbi:glycosyltransferase family 4 protein [Microbacteriaceae bacterium VKM Ac-2855]|nr:glycosyltransferase family 4 protein [Microbacteriaceae bacterium VKM Ac-2855]